METLDLSSKYLLTNAYTLSSKQLASNGDKVFMDDASTSDAHQWYITSTDLSPYYRLHTVANGDTQALDVLNDNGTASTSLQFYEAGAYSGQYWRFDAWGDGTFRLSNNYTGVDMHLDTYSGTLEPFLGDGDHTGQHWTFGVIGGASASSSAVSSTATSSLESSTSTSSTTSSASSSKSAVAAATSSDNSSLSIGAIVGIAIGGALALVVCICAVVFVLRSKRKARLSGAQQNVGAPPSYYAAQQEKYHAPAELVGGEVQMPVEMPGYR